jgi:hypothetical protein
MQAIDRLERALSRVEATAARRPEADPRVDAELQRLRAVHQSLRGKVESAISQIDRMLESAEGA